MHQVRRDKRKLSAHILTQTLANVSRKNRRMSYASTVKCQTPLRWRVLYGFERRPLRGADKDIAQGQWHTRNCDSASRQGCLRNHLLRQNARERKQDRLEAEVELLERKQ